ncbi:MAG TPA: hypothetical protein VGO14_10690 [Solirubrobacteraceae bacterium]|jgi:hypothetical protein|nr:hypothetical protein [Solirubrobacteraceae bacterium]
MGLFLVAALVVSAFAASSASALPEVGRCVAKAGGFYATGTCGKKLKEATGTFEWLKGAGGVNKFTAKSGEAVLEGASGTKIVCKESTAVGKYDEDGTTKAIKGVESVVSTFHVCEDPGIGKICHSAGQAEGTIVTEVLEGELRYLKKIAPIEVVQELHPASKTGPFAVFECGLPTAGGIKVTVKENKTEGLGSKGGGNCILSRLSEVNVMAKSVNDIFKGSGGVQEPHKYLSQTKPPECNLESEFGSEPAPYERSTQTETAEVISEETLEVKA